MAHPSSSAAVSVALKRHCELLNNGKPTSIVQCEMECERKGEAACDREILAISRRKIEPKQALFALCQAHMSADDESDASDGTKSSGAPRSCKNLRPCCPNDNGEMVFCTPQQTAWCLLCVKDPHCVTTVPKFIDKFRRRLRVPHSECVLLLDDCRGSGCFNRWTRKDAAGCPSSPLSLMVLGALRCLGRGLTFDDLEECTAIGEEAHRQFFHIFIGLGQEQLHPGCASVPRTANDFETHQAESIVGGLTGAGFSTDGTHVILWNCSASLRQSHLGFKLTDPARALNLTTNHRRETLHATKGHPGRWNDKSLAHHDEFMSSLRKGLMLQDVAFELLEWEGAVGASSIRKRRHRGGWGIVDNGCHKWSCTQAPAKTNVVLSEQRFSDWIESFRKDAECVLGILKGRWRILKTGIGLHSVEAADRAWMTCCALHNRPLEVDGLEEPWIGSLGENDASDMRAHAPMAPQRLADEELRRFGSREHENAVRLGEPRRAADDDGCGVPLEDPASNPICHADGSLCVNSLSDDAFRAKLTENCDILFRQHKIRWPTRK